MLRSHKEKALSIACDRAFKKNEIISQNRAGIEHKSYLQLWKLIKKADREISIMFDDLKRSNAIHKLASWKYYSVISQEDFEKFTEDTQQSIETLEKIMHYRDRDDHH